MNSLKHECPEVENHVFLVGKYFFRKNSSKASLKNVTKCLKKTKIETKTDVNYRMSICILITPIVCF